MPNYVYRCLNCQKQFEVYMSYSEYEERQVECPHCNSQEIQRRIGRIRFARSEESRLESMVDPSAIEGLEDDPRAMGKMMKQMSQEMGEDMGPEFDEVIDRLEAGQSPEDIEKSIPELSEGAGDMGAGEFPDF